jgi:membrane protein
MLTLLSPEQKIHETVSTIISDFIRHEKTVLLSFSILLTMYFSSNGMMGLMDNFESQLPGFGTRGAIAQRGIAILLTLMLILVVLLTIVVMMLQSWIISYLGSEILQNIFVLKLFAYILLIAVCFITISFTYKYGTAYEDRWKLFSPGAVIATFLITTSTSILFYAVNNLVNYNKIYGSIGTLIIFLIWINFIAQILLIGFDLNASIIVHRAQQKNLLKTNETEQV